MLSFFGPRQEKRLNHKLPRPLRGVITAMVTPLDQDLSLDQKGLERLIEHLIAGGVHGIFILGTTGEAPNLPYSVRSELIERSCKLAGSRVPIIVGITDTSYQDALRMAAKSYECGAVAVVAAPPYYFQVGQPDLLQYFKRMAADSPLPLFLYNAPLNTRLWIEVPTVIEAAAVRNIVGLKDSGLNMGYFHAVRESVRSLPDFSLLVGPDDLLAEAVLLGAHGGMAGGSNVNPRLFVESVRSRGRAGREACRDAPPASNSIRQCRLSFCGGSEQPATGTQSRTLYHGNLWHRDDTSPSAHFNQGARDNRAISTRSRIYFRGLPQ